MAKPFNELRERLLRAGVAPRHVRRYLTELADHLADLRADEEREGRSRAEAESAALARLGGMDDLAQAMIEQRQFQSWCARAPWAMLGLRPLFLLAGAYFVAGLILWSGWKIFLPEADTPFVRIHGLAIFYFGVGRLDYFAAPLFIGWFVGFIAARQSLKAIWPIVGLTLISLIGGTARFHAVRSAVRGEIGRVGVNFAFGPPFHGISYGVLHALVILLLTALPYLTYLIWRLRKAHALSA